MRKTTVVLLLVILGLGTWVFVLQRRTPKVLVFPNANSRNTYFTIHNLRPAHAMTRGRGVKVGILDHYFGTELHGDLYAGSANFLGRSGEEGLTSIDDHGYWMSLVLREIAPEAEIYALNAVSSDEKEKVDAMIAAIDWAIAHKLDVLTYSHPPISAVNRQRLDEAVTRAQQHNIVTTFIHYPQPGNILPGPLGREAGLERDEDVNILQYDYNVVFMKDYRPKRSKRGMPPFLSMSSTSPVTGGIVALMRSVRPELTPALCKQILSETSHAMEFEGRRAPHVVDAAAAVDRARKGT